MSPKQKKRRARHARRVSRRAVLKQTPTMTRAVKLIVPRMIHSEIIIPQHHPTWDKVLNHLSRQTTGMETVDRRLELDLWVQGLVLQPSRRQPALLLIGPECSGKTMFHQAMGLLLPDRAVLRFPEETRCFNWQGCDRRSAWEKRLEETWLIVVQENPARYVGLFRRSESRGGRFFKWCLLHTHDVDPLPNVQRFDVGLPDTTITSKDLLHRLDAEREAFQRTLAKYKGAA